MKIKSDIPLFDFFYAWQDYERSYGRVTSDSAAFLLLLNTLAKGHALLSKADLYHLCKTILFKPGHEEEDFQALFDQYIQAIQEEQKKVLAKEALNKEEKAESKDKIKEEEKKKAAKAKAEKDRPKPSQEEIKAPEKTISAEQQEAIHVYFEDLQTGVEGITVESDKQEINQHVFQKRFIVKGDDYLLPQRILQQAWRSMRTLKEMGPRKVLDIPKTIDRVARQGYFDEAEYKPAYQNEASLLLLIDASPSMVAFRDLGRKMVDTAKQDRHFKHLHVYYFENIPGDYLFQDEHLLEAIDIADFLRLPKMPALIFSDAGSSRGRLMWERIEETNNFLQILNAPRVAWVNPMPRNRWLNTSAEVIAQSMEMFTCEALELRNAVKLLRGKLK